MQLHDPCTTITPSQRSAATARAAFRANIASQARPDRGISLRPPKALVVFVPAPASPEKWEDRQRSIPIPKRRWFSVLDDLGPTKASRPQIEDIIKAVSLYYEVPRDALLSARRTDNLVRPRQVGMYLCKTLTLRTLPFIGRRFGGRDHSTVLHAVRKIKHLIPTDAELAAEIEAIRLEILG